jgi:hypothetical protein
MINVWTFQFNNPDFLEYQHKTFSKFLKQEHKLICVNNSFDKPHEKEAIRATAERLGIQHIVPESTDPRSGGYGHQHALNWAWHKFIFHSSDVNIIVDHDMFPIREVPIDLSYDIVGVMQGRGEHIRYFHPGIMIINNTLKDKETVDFKGEQIDGHWCDSGGNWHHYLNAHPDLKIKGLSLVNICAEHENLHVIPEQFREGYNEQDPIQYLENYILHFRNGSNWAWTEQGIYNRKIEQMKQTLDYYLSL